MTTLDQAIAQMRANGMPEFPPGHPKVGVGRITRYGPKKNAWYVLHCYRTRGNREVIVGAFGYWGKLEPCKIEVEWKGFSSEERADLEERAREQERIERAKREDRARRAANRGLQQWRAAMPLAAYRAWLDEHGRAGEPISAYLERKGVAPERCRFFEDGTILVPMLHYDATDGARLAGLQKIATDGTKRFNKGMAKEGAACLLGDPPADGDPILVSEGFATGLSIREAVMQSAPVYLAFDAGNLKPVAERLRARYPLSPIIFCADDDWKTKRPDGTPWNPGVDYAHAAARSVGYAWVVRPLFDERAREDGWTDFNDLHAASGIIALREQLNLQRVMSETPAVMREGQTLAISQEDREIAAQLAAIREFRVDPAEDAGGGGGGGGAPPDGGADTPTGPDGGKAPRPRTWFDEMQRGRDFAAKASVFNAVLYLANHRAWDGVLAYDTFAETVVKLRPPPFPNGAALGEWTELDDHHLLLWFSNRIGEPGTEAISKAVQVAAHRHEFNPLRDRLEALQWDGVRRLHTWLHDYLGACTGREFERLAEPASKHDPKATAEQIAAGRERQDRIRRYCELVGVKWMVAAIARVFDPGCKFDEMLVLEGGQGARKSTTAKILGGDWYTDARLNFMDKDSKLILQGRWIIEMAELEGMNKAETSETKRFLSEDTDLFRPPYGRKLIKFPRRCVFIGTVNLDAYLKDETGNRRFWPVRVGALIDTEKLRADVDQLWAEAVHLYREKTPYWVLPDERQLFEEQQEERYATDAWEDLIIDYLDGRGDGAALGALAKVTTKQVLESALKLDKSRWDRQAMLRVVGVLRRNGWIRARESTGSRQWFYVRPEPPPKAAGEAPARMREPGEDDDDPI